MGRFLLLCSVLGLCLTVPGGSLGAAGAETDLALVPEYVERTDGLGLTDDLTIGQTITFHWTIKAVSGDPAPFTVQVTWPANPVRAIAAYWAAVPSGGTYDSDCTYTLDTGSVTLSCPAGVSFSGFNLGLRAHSPRELSVTATVSSPNTDPDLSNNGYSWAANVVCSITGTPGDDLLIGTAEPDSICGGDGNDHLVSVGDEDWLFGQGGDDLYTGQGHATAYAIGGTGFDTVSYEDSDRAITLCRHEGGYTTNQRRPETK